MQFIIMNFIGIKDIIWPTAKIQGFHIRRQHDINANFPVLKVIRKTLNHEKHKDWRVKIEDYLWYYSKIIW